MDLLNDLVKMLAPYGAPGLIIAVLMYVVLKLYRQIEELHKENREIAVKNATVLAENTASNVSVAQALSLMIRNGSR